MKKTVAITATGTSNSFRFNLNVASTCNVPDNGEVDINLGVVINTNTSSHELI
jgi:hypothetical protein